MESTKSVRLSWRLNPKGRMKETAAEFVSESIGTATAKPSVPGRCMADEPVAREPVSTVDFPINRENTGNILENRPWDGKSCRRFFPRNQVVGQLIPCSAKQGILSRRSGKIRGRSGKRAGVSAN